MIAKRLWNSKKAAALSDRCFGVYVLCVVNANVRGRFEADGLSLLAAAGMRGIVQGWTSATIETDVAELIAAGLLTSWTIDGAIYAEVVDFLKFNTVREEREAESKIPDPPGMTPAGPSTDRGSTPGALRKNSTELQLQGERELEDEVVRARVASAVPGPASEEGKIRGAYHRAFERFQAELPARDRQPLGNGLTPAEVQAAKDAARENSCAGYTSEALEGEFLAQLRRLHRDGFPVSLRAAVNNRGKRDLVPRAPKQAELLLGPVGLVDGRKVREELDRVALETTPEAKARVAAHVAEWRKLSGAPGRAIAAPAVSSAAPAAERKPGPLAEAVAGIVGKCRAREPLVIVEGALGVTDRNLVPEEAIGYSPPGEGTPSAADENGTEPVRIAGGADVRSG